MEILEIRTLRGPNYWSGYWKKLIIMRLDIGDYEEKPTDKLDDFYNRMVEVMPTLQTHGCSYQEPGGFLRRVGEGTWAGHVIEHLALELQTLAAMPKIAGNLLGMIRSAVQRVINSCDSNSTVFPAQAGIRLHVRCKQRPT